MPELKCTWGGQPMKITMRYGSIRITNRPVAEALLNVVLLGGCEGRGVVLL